MLMRTNILTPFGANANLMPGRKTFALLLWLIETSKKVLFRCKASFSTMESARIEGTLWNVLYYLVGAVNRFLRPEPSHISNDPLQESTAESDSGGDGHTASHCKDQSEEADGERTQNAHTKEPEPLNALAEESVATFSSVNHLNLIEKTTATLENSSRPKTQDMNSDRAGKLDTEYQLKVGLQPEGCEDNSSLANGQSDAMTGESAQVDKVEEELFGLDASASCKEEVASLLPVKPEGETAQEIKKMPLRSACDVSQQPHTATSEEPLPVHNNEAFPDGKKTRGFLAVEESEEMQTHEHLQEEAESKEQEILRNNSVAKHDIHAEETTATCASSKMRVKRPEQESDAPCGQTNNVEDLEQGIEVVEQDLRLGNAAGDNNETRRETVGFSREELPDADNEWVVKAVDLESKLTGSSSAKQEKKPIDTEEDGERETDEVVEKGNKMLKDSGTTLGLMTTRKTEETALSSVCQNGDAIPEPSSEDNFDSKQNKIANESLEKRYDTESFIELSLLELGLSDESFAEAQTAAKASEIQKTDSELRRSGSDASRQELSKYSGEPLKAKIQSLDKVENPEVEKSRIAVKNPRARPPKDRRSLLLRPSVEPVAAAPPPASKMPVGVHVLGGLGLGIRLPGLGPGFPLVRKLPKMQQEAALKPVPKIDETKQAEEPQKTKWMPPRQTGFRNPFISELKTKLKKATKN
ncbi:uncharacterized protein LOC144004610 isoform X2 [Festucalex cinctus]